MQPSGNQAVGLKALLAVVITAVSLIRCRSEIQLRGVSQGNPVLAPIDGVLLRVELDLHGSV